MRALNDLLMPKLGLTMTEGLLVEWCVQAGQAVSAGDVLFVVETEKVANEIQAHADGVVAELLVAAGDTVPVGAVVARWTGPGQGVAKDDPSGDVTAAAATAAPASAGQTAVAAVGAVDPLVRVVATPLARRLAREHGLDLHRVSGTGPNGRIKAADVRASLAQTPQASPSGLPHADAPRIGAAPSQADGTTLQPGDGKGAPAASLAPASGLVQAMARRMTDAKQVPHFYLSAEAEVSALLDLRKRLNADDSRQKLTLNHFVIAAVARALQLLPQQNRIWQDDGILSFDGIDVGVAVSTERGLVAPVLHDLSDCALDDIAARANALVERVRQGRNTRDDMAGGAITISNAGMFNVTYMTPIINPPQSAILGVGSIREAFRPDASGAPALRREMGLVLAADHRLHDGASGLKFLNCVIDLLQDPYRLLRSGPSFQG